ncbi:shikimate kinase [Paeniglutamicibacter antarcticus]|uniref:Shikimate kinase n=1 Tax=Paeniglutamicibacter antarcticus TaxID=494023 RepID=A0ABP9TN24_9MICC
MSTPIVLIGPMASGKSAVGALLAPMLDAELIDTDALVVAAHGPIASIFAVHGEEGFRRFESEALALAMDRSAQTVVSTGGGAVLAPGNRELLADGFCVYLLTDARTVAPRIGADRNRPLLGADPLQSWSRIFDRRKELYEGSAHLTIDTRGLGVGQVACLILTAYRDAGH